jgi:translation initiation factor IF-2
MRIYELAKEIGVDSKELLGQIQDFGVEAKSHMSSVDDVTADHFRTSAASGGGTAVATAPDKEAPAIAPQAVVVEAKEETPAPASEQAADTALAEDKDPTGETQKSADEDAPADDDGSTLRFQGPIVVKELAARMNFKPNRLIADLMAMNVLASINERLDVKVAQNIARKHGFSLEYEKRSATMKPVVRKSLVESAEDDDQPEDLIHRPPIVTFLGHVDHGKTSLLDKIRNSSVASGESGGITQHIGASVVETNGQQITFLDTPGHEAFTAMRARGANLTDIAVIIIAADDGVMAQTEEAIQHARAAEVTIMIAINKIDLPAANIDRVKQQLQGLDLAPEDWGGSTICAEVSAMTGDGVGHLLDMILLQSEVMELTANPTRRAQGYVIEAELQQGRGPTSSLLVTSGTLNVGDAVLCKPHWGRVRALTDDKGVKLQSAGPSTPVVCIGLCGVPEAGSEFQVYQNEKAARVEADSHLALLKQEKLAAPKRSTSIADVFESMKEDEKHVLKVILKADTQGSVEAIRESLLNIESDKISLDVILSGTGNITENDINLASASAAIVVAFHVSQENGVGKAVKAHGVEIFMHSIIYELLDQVRDLMTGMLDPELRERVLGHAEVRQVFPISKTGKIAGCFVTDGRISSRMKIRVKRGDDVVYEGSMVQLKRFQNDASEVREGQECGIRLDNFANFDEGDILEVYEVDKVAQTL